MEKLQRRPGRIRQTRIRITAGPGHGQQELGTNPRATWKDGIGQRFREARRASLAPGPVNCSMKLSFNSCISVHDHSPSLAGVQITCHLKCHEDWTLYGKLSMTQGPSGDGVVIIGAGMGGLGAAIDLAGKGVPVTVVEKASTPGGKMRTLEVGGQHIDAGPTVMTLRSAFDDLFEEAGSRFEDHVGLVTAERLARHAWDDTDTFDLMADPEASVEEVDRFFGGKQARLFAKFLRDGSKLYDALTTNFLLQPQTNPIGLTTRMLMNNPGGALTLRPFSTLWSALGDYFPDARLRQLFGRYATYCGASPWSAPATLMMIAELEQRGVWYVKGGMSRLAHGMAGFASQLGADIRYDAPVDEILIEGGTAKGVRLQSGETIRARAVLSAADPDALRSGLLGDDARKGLKPAKMQRSLSALVWTATGKPTGFELDRHNVVFSPDYRAEFDALFTDNRIPDDPTIYICAQDRGAGSTRDGAERFLILINAPADGDTHTYTAEETDPWLDLTLNRLRASGLNLDLDAATATGPDGFARLCPGSSGAIYGRALHGWQSAFQRPGARTQIPGLYLAGGGTHPGPGVPTSMISGRTAARSILADLALTPRSRPAGIAGSTQTPSATTDATASS